MIGIEAAFEGNLSRDPEGKISKNGKPYCNLTVYVAVSKGEDGKWINQFVNITCFGDAAGKIASDCKKGDRIYCEGNLTLSSWKSKDTGEDRYSLSVSARKCEKMAAIGRNKAKGDTKDFDDDMPW